MDNKNEPVHLNGKVKINKDGEGKKFLKLFLSGSFLEASQYAFTNVFIPYTKDIICKMTTNIVNFWVNGDKPSINQQSGPNRVSYWNGTSYNGRVGTTIQQTPIKTNNVYSVGTLYFDNRGDAETILLKLKENLETYKVATVADLYELSNQKFNYTDYKYGWRSLSTASVCRTNDGQYVIDLPKAIPLE